MHYIGIIGRQSKDRTIFNQEIINVIYKYNCLPLGIIVDPSRNNFDQLKPLIDLCDGFILQGGNMYYDIDIKITKYLHQHNIPTLGICLGMQTMAVAINGSMIIGKLSNHNSTNQYVHNIIIDENSKLYQIIKKRQIAVNSRHNDNIINTDLKISSIAKSNESIIESIEDPTKNFFIGVQWHPETLMDENSIALFENFFKLL